MNGINVNLYVYQIEDLYVERNIFQNKVKIKTTMASAYETVFINTFVNIYKNKPLMSKNVGY